MTAPVARARPHPRWVLPEPPDDAAVRALADALHLPLAVCRLLWQRGHRDVDRARRYLRPRLDQLHDPSLLLDLDVAVARLSRAIRDGETVLVHGDYDVDGISSTTILLRTLRALGGRAEPFIPNRLTDGYDLSMAGVEAARRAGARVLVTCDCGTNATGPIAAARESGIDVIVTDHHLPSGPLPACTAMLNPRRPGCAYPDKDLAAAGVAFKLALALTRALGGDENLVYRQLDLVALATIADIAPLRGENRVLARFGLKVLNDTANPGLRALIRAAGLEGKPLTAGRVGFVLAPRLNAAGRIGHAIRGVELLLAASDHEANVIARELEQLNRERQELDRGTLQQAMRRVDALDLDATWGVVLAEPGWHPGVVGIVASRLLEELCRPVVLVALEGAEGKGSGRSIPAFDLHAGLAECRDLLVRFGGHRAAAGVTVAAAMVEPFAQRFNDVARSRLTARDLVPELRVDLDVRLADITDDLETLLRHFEPFGVGNPAPTLAARGVQLHGAPRTMGQGHLKLRLAADGAVVEAVGWGMGALASQLDPAVPMDVAFRLERDEWNGTSRLRARLADLRP